MSYCWQFGGNIKRCRVLYLCVLFPVLVQINDTDRVKTHQAIFFFFKVWECFRQEISTEQE